MILTSTKIKSATPGSVCTACGGWLPHMNPWKNACECENHNIVYVVSGCSYTFAAGVDVATINRVLKKAKAVTAKRDIAAYKRFWKLPASYGTFAKGIESGTVRKVA